MALSLIQRLNKYAHNTPDEIVKQINSKGWQKALGLSKEQYEELLDIPIYFFNVSSECYELGNRRRPESERIFRDVSPDYQSYLNGWWDNWWFIPVSEWSEGCETSLLTSTRRRA